MQKIAIAKIIKPQGIKGECKLAFLTNDLSLFDNLEEIIVGDKLYKVKNLSIRFGFGYITFEGVVDRNQAELLRNKKLFINKEEISLKENEYIIEDIIGFDIITTDNKHIGTLLEVEQFGAADVFVIEQYKREYRVPFLKNIFLKVVLQDRKIVIDEKAYDEVKICD